jgi:hypothetical protein
LARCSEPPLKVTFSRGPLSILHLEILKPSLAKTVSPSSSRVATRNISVLTEGF